MSDKERQELEEDLREGSLANADLDLEVCRDFEAIDNWGPDLDDEGV